MVAGEYSFDYANSRILYKPTDGADPSDYARVIVKANDVLSLGDNGTVDNIQSIWSGFNVSSGAGIFRSAAGRPE